MSYTLDKYEEPQYLTRNQLIGCIVDDKADAIFNFSGKRAVITMAECDDKIVFRVSYGEEVKEYYDIEELLTDKTFDGMSIDDLIGDIKFSFL